MSEVVLPDGVDHDFPLWVVEEEDDTLTIHWDENHPVTSFFNGWTEEMFLSVIRDGARETLGEIE